MGFAVVKPGIIVSVLLILVFFPSASYAEADYVLPYPSAMPGSKLYLLHKLEERLTGYWYFGDYGNFIHSRLLSDRYLVEAKTLFEYKQYRLALHSLENSSRHFKDAVKSVQGAQVTKPGRKEKLLLATQQAQKHQEVLEDLRARLPKKYIWRDEHEDAKELQISRALDHAINIRREQI